MNKINITVQAAVLAVVLALTLSPWAVIQAACNTSLIAVAPDSRYIDNGNATITDKVTGLMWKQCSEGQSSTSTACDTGSVSTFGWQQALQQAGAVNTGAGFAGFTDWRLPSHKELSSLVERQCFSPAINTNLFPNTPSLVYISSSPGAGVARNVWGVEFGGGGVGDYVGASDARVRLVRGGF